MDVLPHFCAMCCEISGAHSPHIALCPSSVQVRTSPYKSVFPCPHPVPCTMCPASLPEAREPVRVTADRPRAARLPPCGRLSGFRPFKPPDLAKYVPKIHQCYRAYAQLSPNANRSLHFSSALLHFQNRCPAFSFLREAQNEKANIKSFGKGWRGCRGGRKEPFPKGFSFPPAGKVPHKKQQISLCSV